MVPVVFLALLSATVVRGDDSSYGVNARCTLDQLMRLYDKDMGLWWPNNFDPNDPDSRAYGWQSANMMTAVADLCQLNSDVKDSFDWVFENTYSNAPGNHPIAGQSNSAKRDEVGFTDGVVYDDEGWWALAFIAADDVTGKKEFLDESIAIWYHINASWNQPDCGGIPWHTDGTGPLAITNELYIQIGAALANRVGDDQKDLYLDAAKQGWDWFQNSGLINSENLINDGLDSDTCENNQDAAWSYNQGVIIGGLVELYRATQDESYLDDASKIANAVTTPGSSRLDDNGILMDGCDRDQSCDDTSAQFKGVFARNLKMLQAVRPSDQWKSFLETNARSIWNNDLEIDDGACKLGTYWGGPHSDETAVSQSSALDCLNAALAVTS